MKKIFYKLGCNFDWALIDGISSLNEEFMNRNTVINEVYGSERRTAYLAARPDFRLPDISRSYFEKYIKALLDKNIFFNYTMNAICSGSKSEMLQKHKEIIDFVRYLENIGIKRITAANPLLMEFIREASSTIELEVSTVAHIDTITQIKHYKETFNIQKVCCNLMKNRSVRWLIRAADYCRENDIALELMVNEFCGAGGKDYLTHCIYRDSCYIYHSIGKTKDHATLFDNYPMGRCIFSRKSDPANWLRARFIRPEDVYRYVRLGIHNFKITGRTGSTEYLVALARAYMAETWSGNLLSLWKPLETLTNEINEFEFEQPVFIDNKKLDLFIDYWFNNPDFDCANEVCGETCEYCKSFYEKNFKL